MSSTSKYTDRRGAADTSSIVLRVTLGDMPPEDALELTLSSTSLAGTLGDVFEQAFPSSPEPLSRVVAGLDLKENPDAREMHDALTAMLREWRAGKCELRFFIGRHHEIALEDRIAEHWRRPPATSGPGPDLKRLDLVIEQRYTPLKYAVGRGPWDSGPQLLDWLRDQTALLAATADVPLLPDAGSETASPLLAAALRVAAMGRLDRSPDTGEFSVTEGGELALAAMAAEAESHFDRYDVFADVLYDEESKHARFGSGHGEDTRVQVYEAEGLDPVRVVFLLRMRDGSLENLLREWRDAAGSEEFYTLLLLPVVDHFTVEAAQLEVIIEAGFALMDEQEEMRQARAARRVALRRANIEGGQLNTVLSSVRAGGALPSRQISQTARTSDGHGPGDQSGFTLRAQIRPPFPPRPWPTAGLTRPGL